jgi:hypothetical protein
MNFAADLRRLLLRELKSFEREVELTPEALLWTTAPGVANPVGNLALHAAGNLRHFIGGVLGGTGYVRDRTAEFSSRDLPRTEVLHRLQQAAAEVGQTLERLDPALLEREYPLEIGGARLATARFLMHLAVHLGFHLGQAGYLRRTLTGENTSAAPVAVSALAEP